MTTLAAAADVDLPRSPRPAVLWAIALAGCAAAGCAFALAVTSDAVRGKLGEPLVIAFLGNWVTVSYVLEAERTR